MFCCGVVCARGVTPDMLVKSAQMQIYLQELRMAVERHFVSIVNSHWEEVYAARLQLQKKKRKRGAAASFQTRGRDDDSDGDGDDSDEGDEGDGDGTDGDEERDHHTPLNFQIKYAP
jgi:hypothetical protein